MKSVDSPGPLSHEDVKTEVKSAAAVRKLLSFRFLSGSSTCSEISMGNGTTCAGSMGGNSEHWLVSTAFAPHA